MSGPMRLVIAWAALILIGTVLFRLPMSAETTTLGWLDALFTSTSAVCVTGLTTITVGHDLSTVGQGVLLLLIQLGGLGISTVSTILLFAIGRATLSDQFDAEQSLAAVRVKPLRLLWWVVSITLVAEGVGTIILANRFGGADAWWLGLFHSVSAFCNAGFSLFPDSLMGYRSDFGVIGVMALLIALGGLGFIALRQMFLWSTAVVRRRRFPLFLHTRVVLAATVAFWVLGAAMFLIFEWSTTLAGEPSGSKLLAAGFQSVTTRTAGFHSLDFDAMREPTLFLTMFLMFIGGAPGSCAGGVKVTTVLVVLATLRAHSRGVQSVTFLRRTIPPDIVRRAFQLITLALLFLTVIVGGLLITEEQAPAPVTHTDHFTALAFEAVSAFGTVGLSTGMTPHLSAGGKLLIIVCMFVGRLGPLVVALAVFQHRPRVRYEYPTEQLAIG
ncbi:MAG: potassium transporter TrkH [Planctomycetes bacterium]|nr:potassium transporter TrkH [Planctomycetota bacterium]